MRHRPPTLAQVPAAPANLGAKSGGDGLVRVSWDHPNDPSITGYESRLRVGSESEWRRDWKVIEGADAETTRVTITNIAPGVTILWALRARNAHGSGASSSVTVTARRRPTARVVASSTTVGLGGTVSLTAAASDPDGGSVTYLWQASSGSFDATDRASVVWTAPSVAVVAALRLTVTDDENETSNTVVRVTVQDPDPGPGPGPGPEPDPEPSGCTFTAPYRAAPPPSGPAACGPAPRTTARCSATKPTG